MQWKSFAQTGTLPFRPPNHQALRVQSVHARKEQEEAMAQGKPQAGPLRSLAAFKKDEE